MTDLPTLFIEGYEEARVSGFKGSLSDWYELVVRCQAIFEPAYFACAVAWVARKHRQAS